MILGPNLSIIKPKNTAVSTEAPENTLYNKLNWVVEIAKVFYRDCSKACGISNEY